ncbi:hypothetical protein EV644_14213 [Kribbella orskensis]|uniref:Uncharacterized protein n=1 Tax=Kribbella orskensis TaxID=2512216 RepID=A0ABY2B6I2_9ACTN|nr:MULTISPECIES: hypothetical protein [Kribbella]TCN28871.1 hypothetical protein EV642_14513 [Kribbella sp. VKM Ac-2500]TCO08981.1 hypothetical protein EV644_14213 [Kribbella orskensis]
MAELDARFGSSIAYLVLRTLEIAVDDEAIKQNPAKARVVNVPAEKGGKTIAWSDEVVPRIVQGHPPQYRPIGAGCKGRPS